MDVDHCHCEAQARVNCSLYSHQEESGKLICKFEVTERWIGGVCKLVDQLPLKQ